MRLMPPIVLGRALSRGAGLLLLGVLPALWAAVSTGADLAEVYRQALRNDPQLREAEATRLATLESRPQALSALLPQLNASAGVTHEDANDRNTTTFFGTTGAIIPATAYARTKTDVTQWRIELRQTLFRWDQLEALRRADIQVAQAEVDFRAAQQDLILRTAVRYFGVLAAKDALDAAEASKEAISQQLEQAEKRFEVGLIAITDVQEAKAAADTAAATVIAAKRTLATAGDQLRELTGEPFTELAKPGLDVPLLPPEPAEEDSWVKAALDQNLSLSSARLASDIARESIGVARAGHLPSLDLVASRSGATTSGDQVSLLSGSDPVAGPFSQAFALPADATHGDKQIGLQLTFPIYAGSGTSSRVREAVYRHRAAREHLERTARATERGTRDAFSGVNSDISHVKALRQALQSAEVALRATEAGYEVGTRTAVDVLLSRQRLYQAQSDYLKSRYDYIIDVLTLEQQAGTLDATRLSRVNGWLKESVTLR